MGHKPTSIRRASLCGIVLVSFVLQIDAFGRDTAPEHLTGDPVIARFYEHLGEERKPLVLAVDADTFPPAIWKRVHHLVAFRLHRHRADGTTVADAAIYLNRDSQIYIKAAATIRTGATQREYIWCLLAAIVAHESAHTTPMTERQALTAEAVQLRRCLFDGHMFTGDGWSPVTYLGKVEAKLKKPREHY